MENSAKYFFPSISKHHSSIPTAIHFPCECRSARHLWFTFVSAPLPRSPALQNKTNQKKISCTTTTTHAFTQTNDGCGALTAGAFMSLPKGPSHSSRLQKHNQQINTAQHLPGCNYNPNRIPTMPHTTRLARRRALGRIRSALIVLGMGRKRKKHEKGVHGLRKKVSPPPPPKAKTLNGHHFTAKQKLVGYFVLKGLKVRRLEM